MFFDVFVTLIRNTSLVKRLEQKEYESPESIRNFRPISLCNTCTKMVFRVIANHLKKVLTDVVSHS